MIDITVEFSDELLLETSGIRSGSSGTLPTIALNNGGEAELVGGTGTRDWQFSYTFSAAAASGTGSFGGDDNDVSVLDFANSSFPFPAAINCTGGCRASNWNGASANLSVRSGTRALAEGWARTLTRGGNSTVLSMFWHFPPGTNYVLFILGKLHETVKRARRCSAGVLNSFAGT